MEVVILRNDKPIGDTHVCDKCLLSMFWVMLERSPNSGIKQQRNNLTTREYNCNLKETELFKKELAAKELFNEATKRQKDALEREKSIQNHQATADELSRSKTLIDAMMVREKELIRLAEARGKQSAIDEFENPELQKSLANRDYKRRGL